MKKEKAPDTKTLILDAAERLFAMHGFEATSLRAITSEAGANLGAVNYHFTSKDALILAVLKRRIHPVNEERLALLTKFEAEAGGALTVEQILEALFRPPMELLSRSAEDGGMFLKLVVKLLAEDAQFLKPLVQEEFAENKRRFYAAMQKASPGLSLDEVVWRMHLAMGAFLHIVAHADLLGCMGVVHRTMSAEETLEKIIEFCAAGFGAPERTSV